MALTDMSIPWQTRPRIKAAPEPLRKVVLAAVNPAMAAELERIEAEPAAALARLRKLTADTAAQLLEFVTSPVALAVARDDKRDVVSRAATTRIHELKLTRADLDAAVTAPKATNGPKDTTASRTQRAVSKPVPEAIEALAKMATLDAGTVLAWSRDLAADTAWEELATALNRHSIREQVLTEALEREVIDPLAAAHSNVLCSPLISIVSSYEKPLNPTMVRFFERCLVVNTHLHQVASTSVTAEAAQYLATADSLIRIVCGVADTEEFERAFMRALGLGTDWREAVEHLTQVAKTARRPAEVDVVVSHLREIHETLGDRAGWFIHEVNRHLLSIEGVSRDAARKLWLNSFHNMDAIVRGEYGRKMDDSDIDWLIQEMNARRDEEMNLYAMLRHMSYDQNEDTERFVRKLLHGLDGGAMEVLGACSSWGTPWMTEIVMSEAAAVLGENRAAWSVFMSQVDSHAGRFDDLVQAAVLATS